MHESLISAMALESVSFSLKLQRPFSRPLTPISKLDSLHNHSGSTSSMCRKSSSAGVGPDSLYRLLVPALDRPTMNLHSYELL